MLLNWSRIVLCGFISMEYAYKKCEPRKFFFLQKRLIFFTHGWSGLNLFNIEDFERRRIRSTLRQFSIVVKIVFNLIKEILQLFIIMFIISRQLIIQWNRHQSIKVNLGYPTHTWIHRRQHRFSYPCFFHLAIRFWSAIFSLD